jgi:K+-sensing histidine kinase KdpD
MAPGPDPGANGMSAATRHADATAGAAGGVRLTRPGADSESMTSRSPDDAFLDVVAHELRTPVTSIYAAAYVLVRDRLDADGRKVVAMDLLVEVERLYRLIEDLVAYGRLTSPETVEREPVLVSRVVLDVIDEERQLVADHPIAFSGSRDALAESADVELVRHVVRSLIDNAVRYAPRGGLVQVVIDETADEIVVRVLDDSPLVKGDVDRALVLRGSANSLTAAQRSGAGLRLHVADRLANAMGGRTWAEPRDGDKSEFGFALPRTA